MTDDTLEELIDADWRSRDGCIRDRAFEAAVHALPDHRLIWLVLFCPCPAVHYESSMRENRGDYRIDLARAEQTLLHLRGIFAEEEHAKLNDMDRERWI